MPLDRRAKGRTAAASLFLLIWLLFALNGARGEAMLQLFQVNWNELIQKMPEIAEAGYTSLWLPPPAKGGSVFSVGYDLFDPFDLGDKNQRGTIPTKYGTKTQLLQVVETAHRFGIRVYFDNIMNHRAFDVPGYDSSTPTNLYPGLRPQDFHLQTISGGFYRNWPSVENYGDLFDVQYESLSGLIDLANEPGGTNGNFGNTLRSTIPKISFVRQPANPEYYMDPSGPVLGGPWKPFNGSSGVPVSEDVNAYLIRAAMWMLYTTKCDGFRLDAVKHVPSGFFGDGASVFNGYTGGIQAMFDWVHGYGTNFTGAYTENDDARNSCFDTEASRNDAMLFGEHLNPPPSFGEYITAGMRLFNVPMRSALDAYAAGGSGAGLDRRDIGAFGANQGVQFAQDHDHGLCCVSHRELHNAYNFMHEGLPMIYSDGFNFAGSPSDPSTFPIVPFANYLGQYGDNKMPDVCYLHHQLARGGTRSRWSDANIIAWERYDYRDVDPATAFNNPDATVVFFAINNNFGNPGDILFDDSVNRTSDGYYTCANGSPSRGYGMRVGFPPGSVLTQLASSSPGADRACPQLLVHVATTSLSQAQATANDPNPVNRQILVNTNPPPGGGAVELLIPSGGWVMYGYQWPEPSQANLFTNAITFLQGGAKVPTFAVYRRDGVNGDPNFNPIYPFKMRGSVDPNGNVIGGVHVSNRTYAIDIPILTNAPFDMAVRCDASAVNVLAKMDGGMDLNFHMGLGANLGIERRDNRPGAASDVFLGYEQMVQQFRFGPEKFAARDVARNNVTSLGAETYRYIVNGTNSVVNGSGNGANIGTATATWVYHDPVAAPTPLGGGPSTQMNPTNPAPGQPVELWIKVGYNFQTNHCFVYYTTDGSNPEGAFGVGKGTTQVIAAGWMNHDSSDNSADWFKATLPGQSDGGQVRYKAAVYRENSDTISDADQARRYGLTQFGITNFDPTSVTVWLHNDRNTNNTITGLSSGFHILRARCFLPRNGKSGVYNTFLQTFYYDAQLPQGAIAFPMTNGTTITSSFYTVVVRADSTVTGVEFNIQDSDTSNDDAVTGLNHGNGSTNGVPKFVAVLAVAPNAQLSQQYPDYPQEFRFNYASVPTNGSATITVRLKEFATSVLSNRFTSLVRSVNTGFPNQVLQLTNPADGAILVIPTNSSYNVQACFSSSLTDTNYSLFSIYINGLLQPRETNGSPAYILTSSGCGPDLNSLSYSWANPMPGSNTIIVAVTNPVSLGDVRNVAVVRPGDSDGDGMSDFQEMIAGTNPFDSNSVLRITSLANNNHLLVWSSVSNVKYQVLATTNLNIPMEPISTVVPASGPTTFYFDPATTSAEKYYRIQVVP